MTHGLVLGKFAPLHRGHQLLIERSVRQCTRTTVLVYEAKEVTRVPLSVRAGWIRRLYPTAVVVEGVNAPTATGRDPAVMRLQENYIGKMVQQPVTHFFSSEWYGSHVSAYLRAEDVRVDEGRKSVPISATLIRNNPVVGRQWLDPLVYNDFLAWDSDGRVG
jgi:HTH-type transcriptional repressor of NAD biosynthesis genes